MLEETTKQLAEVSSERDALQIEVNDLTSAIEQLEILQKEGEDSLEATKAALKSTEDNLASMQVLLLCSSLLAYRSLLVEQDRFSSLSYKSSTRQQSPQRGDILYTIASRPHAADSHCVSLS